MWGKIRGFVYLGIFIGALVLADYTGLSGWIEDWVRSRVAHSQARDALRDIARDPDSLKFRNLRHLRREAEVVCGEVKGRNAYGGYSNFQAFVAYETPDGWLALMVDPIEGREDEIVELRSLAQGNVTSNYLLKLYCAE